MFFLPVIYSLQSLMAGWSFGKDEHGRDIPMKKWQKVFNAVTRKYYTIAAAGLISLLILPYHEVLALTVSLVIFWGMGWSRWLNLCFDGNKNKAFDKIEKTVFDKLILFRPSTHKGYRLYGCIGYFLHSLVSFVPSYLSLTYANHSVQPLLAAILTSFLIALSYWIAGIKRTRYSDWIAKGLSGFGIGLCYIPL